MDSDKVKENQHCYFIVSEPWDYVNPNYGNNRIYGTVLKACAEYLLFKAEDTVNISGRSGDIFLLLPRYTDQINKADTFASSYNGGLLLCTYDSNMNREKLESKSVFVMIGSLEKI